MTINKPENLSHVNDHDYCLLCGSKNPFSQKLVFRQTGNQSVSAIVDLHVYMQGYTGILHGGVISAFLDAAMTHCLYSNGIQGLTCELRVRFLHSIPCEGSVKLNASISETSRKLFRLKSEIFYAKELMAWASGTFLRRITTAD